jgi:hypothetical protein
MFSSLQGTAQPQPSNAAVEDMSGRLEAQEILWRQRLKNLEQSLQDQKEVMEEQLAVLAESLEAERRRRRREKKRWKRKETERKRKEKEKEEKRKKKERGQDIICLSQEKRPEGEQTKEENKAVMGTTIQNKSREDNAGDVGMDVSLGTGGSLGTAGGTAPHRDLATADLLGTGGRCMVTAAAEVETVEDGIIIRTNVEDTRAQVHHAAEQETETGELGWEEEQSWLGEASLSMEEEEEENMIGRAASAWEAEQRLGHAFSHTSMKSEHKYESPRWVLTSRCLCFSKL